MHHKKLVGRVSSTGYFGTTTLAALGSVGEAIEHSQTILAETMMGLGKAATTALTGRRRPSEGEGSPDTAPGPSKPIVLDITSDNLLLGTADSLAPQASFPLAFSRDLHEGAPSEWTPGLPGPGADCATETAFLIAHGAMQPLPPSLEKQLGASGEGAHKAALLQVLTAAARKFEAATGSPLPEAATWVVAECTWPVRPTRELLATVLFEEFAAQALFVGAAAQLALYGAGQSEGLVVGVGDTTCYAVPFVHGFMLESAAVVQHMGMHDVTTALWTRLVERYSALADDLAGGQEPPPGSQHTAASAAATRDFLESAAGLEFCRAHTKGLVQVSPDELVRTTLPAAIRAATLGTAAADEAAGANGEMELACEEIFDIDPIRDCDPAAEGAQTLPLPASVTAPPLVVTRLDQAAAAEALFAPAMVGKDLCHGLHHMVLQATSAVPNSSERVSVLSSMHLVGPTALLPGLQHRLQSSIRATLHDLQSSGAADSPKPSLATMRARAVKSHTATVVLADDPSHCVWSGAATISALPNLGDLSVSRAEFQEGGVAVVSTKLFGSGSL